MQALQTTTNYWLVLISILTSMVACYAAFSLAERMASARGRAYFYWLASGALAMGLGIWSMHYLGMLSVRLPMEVVYHVPTVLLSLLLAVFAAAVVLVVVSRSSFRLSHGIGGSLLMGVGIGGMHYTGMHAMRCSAMHHYQPFMVALSILTAVSFSWVALWIAFSVRARADGRESLKIGAAALMGMGIAAMHYIAMAAVTFEGTAMPYSTRDTVHISTIGVAGIALTIGIVLLATMFTTLVDRRVYEQMRRLHLELSEERDNFHAAAECSLDGLYICSAIRDRLGEIEDFAFIYLNSNVERMVAIPRSRMIGGRMCELQPLNRTLGLFERYKQVVTSGEPMVCELSVHDKDLNQAWIRVQAVKVRDGVAITTSDITARKQNEERILHLAHHDPLTGLLNRSLLSDRIGQALEQSRRNGTMAAISLIDLDLFKQVNDTYGHAAGDCVLVTIASRLTSAVRALDSVVRIGGDEFIVVMPELKRVADAQRVAEKMLLAIQSPILIEGQSVRISCSIGIAVYPESAGDVEALLSEADTAMYTAKGLGKNQYQIAGSPGRQEPALQPVKVNR
jgi:diguanylate cyclase (GGDEF)-like protein